MRVTESPEQKLLAPLADKAGLAGLTGSVTFQLSDAFGLRTVSWKNPGRMSRVNVSAQDLSRVTLKLVSLSLLMPVTLPLPTRRPDAGGWFTTVSLAMRVIVSVRAEGAARCTTTLGTSVSFR